MGLGKSCAIFFNIDSKEYTDMEKAYAIRDVLNMATHNGITKDEILKVAKYLFDLAYEEVQETREVE